jgi:long-chain fatty acid transport protein
MKYDPSSPTPKVSRRFLKDLQPQAFRLPATVAVLMFAGLSVRATDGYFSSAYGIKATGRAGVALTETDDAFGGANNPATISFAEDRFDLGVNWFRPERSAERTGPATPLNGHVASGHRNFFIPDFAYKSTVNEHWAVGVSIYGNGGMNTDYAAGQLNLGGPGGQNLLAGQGTLGVNLAQVLVAPTLAWKISESQSLGLSNT